MSKKTFDEFYEEEIAHRLSGTKKRFKLIWDHQQKKIDQLLTDKTKMREEYRQLDKLYLAIECDHERLQLKHKELNDAQARHIEYVNGLHEKIDELKGEVERLDFNCKNWKGKADNLTAQIELLTRCEYPYKGEFKNDTIKCYLNITEGHYCQGCKNKQQLEKDKK